MKYGKYFVLLLFLLLCPFFVSAQDNAISKMIVKEVSGSTVAGATSISGNTVTPDIDFYEVGDSVSYQLFVNYDSSKYKISYVSDNNKNRYVKTSYAVIDDKVFMTVTYPKKIAVGYGVDPFKIFVKLQYKNGKPIIPDDVLIPPGFVNPPTGLIAFVLFSLLVIGSIVLSYVRKKKYYLLLILLVPFLVYAKQSDTIEVNLNTNNVNIAYRVSFNGNGATGSMPSITCFIGQNCQLSANQFTNEQGVFLGWSKTATGSVLYTDAQEVPDFGKKTTLYAIWKKKYQVKFNGNGSTSGTMSAIICIENESCQIPSNTYERTNYTFKGWSTSPIAETASYNSGSSYTNITTEYDVTLYAVWWKNYTVHYNGNGSTSGTMDDTICVKDTPCTLRINTFEKIAYMFSGWATSSTGSSTYSNGGTYTNITTGDEITLYAYWTVFDHQDFGYTGNVQTFTVPVSGNYKLEVWGAQGGAAPSGSYPGGRGGYSYGEISLSRTTQLYVYVGGSGTTNSSSTANGGFNGGGACRRYGGSGGGATHIATKSGELKTLASFLSDILIVAGGGGGAYGGSNPGRGGDGGGYLGTIGTGPSTTAPSGGSQTTGYAFGLGESSNSVGNTGGAGGGGFYGGYAANNDYGTGAGGSGYIGNSLLRNKGMYCYDGSSSSDSNTLTYSTLNYSSDAISYYAKNGPGYARITYLGA